MKEREKGEIGIELLIGCHETHCPTLRTKIIGTYNRSLNLAYSG